MQKWKIAPAGWKTTAYDRTLFPVLVRKLTRNQNPLLQVFQNRLTCSWTIEDGTLCFFAISLVDQIQYALWKVLHSVWILLQVICHSRHFQTLTKTTVWHVRTLTGNVYDSHMFVFFINNAYYYSFGIHSLRNPEYIILKLTLQRLNN